jgi:MoxR-like ATPase
MRCVFTSTEDLRARLHAAKYVVSDAHAEVLFDALHSNLALLVERPPGSGKTERARALTLAAGTQMERLQCYEGIGQEDEYDRDTPEFRALVAASKFHIYPHFGEANDGYLLLQDHCFPVSFRNIKIRELPPTSPK